MTFDFMTTAVPASQPVPPSGTPAFAAADDQGSAAAFDAALAETLAVIDRQAARDTTGGIELLMPAEWIFPPLSAPIAETAAGDIEYAAVDAAPDDDATDATLGDKPMDPAAVPVDVTVVVPAGPAIAVAPNAQFAAVPSVRIGAPTTAGGVRNGTEERPSPAVQASALAPPALQASAVASPDTTAAGGAERTESGGVPSASANRETAWQPSTGAPPAPAPVPVAVVARRMSVAADPAPVASADTPAASSADAADSVADALVPGAGDAGRTTITAAAPESRRAAMRYMADAAQQMRTSATPAIPQPQTVPAATVDVAATAVPASVPRAADVPATPTPQGGAAIQVGPGAGPESQLSGEQDPSQGQERPSPEFVRFAAALAQVGLADRDDSGRAVGPVASAPAAPTAPSAVAPAVVASAAPVTMTPGEENVGRLVQAMRVNARPGAWEATVRLNPEHLGEVTIAMRVERNTVTAVVNAESAGVRQWLETQEQAVRSGMAEHGLQLERFTVQRDGQRRETPEQEAPPQQRRRQPKPDPQAPERFEILV